MNRRESFKAIGLTTLSTGLLVGACKTSDKTDESIEVVAGRQPFEVARDKKLEADAFFSEHEMATITLLSDIIIPKDEKSGSASDAGVPAFIEFIVKDMPDHQIPMRGGLLWLDMQCLNRYDATFVEASEKQQLEMVTEIAYPNIAKPEIAQGVAFFRRMRDLTASGFFTSEIGIKDLGYMGNVPTRWTGVPDDVLKQYNMQDV